MIVSVTSTKKQDEPWYAGCILDLPFVETFENEEKVTELLSALAPFIDRKETGNLISVDVPIKNPATKRGTITKTFMIRFENDTKAAPNSKSK